MQGCSLGDKSRVHDRLARHIQSKKHTPGEQQVDTIAAVLLSINLFKRVTKLGSIPCQFALPSAGGHHSSHRQSQRMLSVEQIANVV